MFHCLRLIDFTDAGVAYSAHQTVAQSSCIPKHRSDQRHYRNRRTSLQRTATTHAQQHNPPNAVALRRPSERPISLTPRTLGIKHYLSTRIRANILIYSSIADIFTPSTRYDGSKPVNQLKADADNRDLIEHLSRQTNLSVSAATNIVAEVLTYYRETPESFVRRRHLELRQHGHTNSAIYATIKSEMEQRLFAAEPHSERQIRRIIYG